MDIANAHGSVSRAFVATRLAATIPALLPWVEGLLTAASEHAASLSGGQLLPLRATAGVDQGCPLSAGLFTVALAPALAAADAAARAIDPAAQVLAYQDDVTILATPAAAAAAAAALQFEAARAGLAVRPGKCELWHPDGPTADVADVLRPIARVTAPTVMRQHPWAMVALPQDGGPQESWVAPAHASVAALVDKRRAFLRALQALREAGLSLQAQWTLLRYHVNTDFTWLARAVGLPPATRRTLDALTVEAVEAAFAFGALEATPRRRLFHPLREGGMGLLNVALTANAANGASWLLCLREAMASAAAPDLDTLVARCPKLQAQLLTAQALANAAAPTRARDQPVYAPAGVSLSQRALARAAAEAEVRAFLDGAETAPALAAWARSCGGPGAGAWLWAPQRPEHVMTDLAFRVAARLRLALPLTPAGAKCPLRGANGAACDALLDAMGGHALGCPCEGLVVRRHNDVVAAIAAAVEETQGSAPLREQVVPVNGEAHRSDLTWQLPNGTAYHLDVAVVHPATRQGLRAGAATRPAAAAVAAEAAKLAKHRARIRPAVLEAGGRPGPALLTLVRGLARQAEEAPLVVARIWQDLSVTLQRANARAVIAVARAAGVADP